MIKEKLNNGRERFKKIKIILRVLKYRRPYTGYFILVLVLSGIGTLLNLVPTYMIKPLTDKVFMPNSLATMGQRIGMLNLLIFMLLLIRIVQSFANTITEYRRKWLGEKIGVNIRMTLYTHLQRLSMKFYNFQKTGGLHSRVCYDAYFLNYFLTYDLVNLFTSMLMCVGIGVILFCMNWKLALFLLVPVPIIFILSGIFGGKMIFAYRILYQKMANMSSVALKGITGAIVVKTNVGERKELLRFGRANRDVFISRMQNTKVNLFFSPLKGFTVFLSGIMIYWFGGRAVISGELTLGALMVFIGYVWQFYTPIETISGIYATYQNAVASAERIFNLLDVEPDIYDTKETVSLTHVQGDIKFDHVTFGYDDKKSLFEGISFEVKAGELVGVTGPSGSGKSTLVYLLCRLYDTSGGSIYVDGYNIRNLKMNSLRNHIGVVLQDTLLFYDTIAENIAYGRTDASPEQIIAAAKAAGAHDFIMCLPDTYDTLIGEGGVGLSGGEKQRISIARVLLKNPKIIVFDEATSAVDLVTEAFICATIESLAGAHTIFVISQRVSMLKNIDKLLVFDKGKLKEFDNYTRLDKGGGTISSQLL